MREQAPGLVDSTVCNCALDACVMNGAAEEAERLVEEMRAAGVCNCVTYNTLIKGRAARLVSGALAWHMRVCVWLEVIVVVILVVVVITCFRGTGGVIVAVARCLCQS